MERFKYGYLQADWEYKNLKQKPIFILELSWFWLGYDIAVLSQKLRR